jgi:hypothetical protein
MENTNKTNTLIAVATTILIAFMLGVMYVQDKTLNEYRNIIEKTDTTVYADTIYLDKVVRDSIPVVQYKKLIVRDTLWHSDGDSIVGEPQIISLVKKKSVTQ